MPLRSAAPCAENSGGPPRHTVTNLRAPDVTTDSPFTPAYSRESFLETPERGDMLRRLEAGLGSREPFLLVTGGPGMGKTALAREAIARWDARVTAAYLAYPALTGTEFLEEILRRFGAEPPEGLTRSKLLACLERALAEIAGREQVAMIVVDDAHGLSPELLEDLRLLVNAAQQAQRPLEVLLVGLPTLEATLDDPALRALRQRVSVHAKLEPFTPADTQRYLHHRVTVLGGDGPGLFARRTCREIAARTGGVPRQINALAGEALRLARAGGDPTVVPEHVRAAAATLGGFATTGEVDDPLDAGGDESRAPAAAPRPVATERAARAEPAAAVRPLRAADVTPLKAAAVSPVSAPAVAPADTRTVAPAASPERRATPKAQSALHESAPAASGARPASAAAVPSRTSGEEWDTPNPSPPAHQDPQEWVKRFVGDKGPLQIGSRAMAETRWTEEPSSVSEAPSPSLGEGPKKPRKRPEPAPPRTRAGHRGGFNLALGAALAAIVVVSAVVLVMRAGGLARNRAGQVAAGTSAATQEAAGTAVTKSAAARRPSRRRAAAPEAPATESPAATATPDAAGETRVEDSIANARPPFSLDVGGYSDPDVALNQRDRVQTLTGMEAWVVPTTGDGGYRIVLGIYRSYERATSAANMLIRSKTLSNVTVIRTPPRSQRH